MAWGSGGKGGEERRARERRRKDVSARDLKASKKNRYDVGRSKQHQGKKLSKKRKVYAAGSNVHDREKRGKYKDSFKTRADDPRNWEFHYDEAMKKSIGWGGGGGKGGENRTSGEQRARQRGMARGRAKKMAKDTGRDVYEIRKLEWETANITQKTKQSAANRKAIGASRTGSTRVAQGVAAGKQMAARKRGGGGARGQSITSPRGNRRSIA